MPAAVIGVAVSVGAAAMSSALMAAGWAAVSAALTSAITGIAASYALNKALGLAPRIRASSPQLELTNVVSNISPVPVIYSGTGGRRVGGAIVFMASSDEPGQNEYPNKYLHVLLVLGEGEVNDVVAMQLDGVDSGADQFTIGDRLFWTHQVGTDDQAADPDLLTYYPDWPATGRLQGVAYIYARLRRNDEAYPNGLPTLTADVEGRKVYDPRDDTWKLSDNPALIIRDYLLNQRFGGGKIWAIDETVIDDDSFGDAADHCEESVTKGGVSAARYTCAAVLSPDDDPRDNLDDLLSSCMGFLDDSTGQLRLIIPKARAASGFDFNEDNIVGGLRIVMGSRDTLLNRVRCKFYNKDLDWQPDLATVDSEALRALDNDVLLEREIELPCTPDAASAKQIATIILNRSRQALVVELRAKLSALTCLVGDVVTITHDTPGWSAKEFEVVFMKHLPTDEVEVTLAEYADDVYDFGTIPASDSAPDTNLPDPLTIAAPGAPTVTEELYTTRSGRGVAAKAIVAWLASEDSYVSQYQVEMKLSTASDWTVVGRTPATTLEVLDIAPGTYDFRVAAIGALPGVLSPYATTANRLITGLAAAPADIGGLRLTALGDVAVLTWDPIADLDVVIGGWVRVRHTRATSGAAWTDGVDLARLPGRASLATLPLQTGTYMLKAVDSSGIESATMASAVTAAPTPWTLTLVDTIQEDTAFSGTKTDCTVTSSQLHLTETAGEVAASGTYEFADSYAGGAVAVHRCEVALEAEVSNIQDEIDDRTEDMDTWPDFDGAALPAAAANVVIECRWKDNSGDSYGAWQAIDGVGNFSGRYAEFRALLSSTDPAYNILISQLRVLVYTY